MKFILAAFLALSLSACELNTETLKAGAQVLIGVASATITELNTAGIDPIQVSPEELAKYAAGCRLAIEGSGLLTGDRLTPEGTQVCELILKAAAKAPTAATELSKE